MLKTLSMISYKTIKEHFRETDSVIYRAMKGVDFDAWLTNHSQNQGQDYFYSLCRKIIGQQLSGKAALAITNKFTGLFVDGKITPESVLAISDEDYRKVGMSWAKASYVKNIAKAYAQGLVDFDNLDSLSDEEIVIQLTKIKGVGNWTAEMFLMFTLNRPNVFSFGDLGLKRGIEKLYEIKDPNREQIESITAPWSPYKTFASITLWHSLE